MKLSDTALIVLNSASGRDDRLVPRRSSVPPVADVNACRALVKLGLAEMVRAPAGVSAIVPVREDDCPMAFVIADAGFRALNLEPSGTAETAAHEADTASPGGNEDAVPRSAVPVGMTAADTPTAAHGDRRRGRQRCRHRRERGSWRGRSAARRDGRRRGP